MDKVQIQIQFTKEQNGLRFTDALYMSQAEYANIKPADLEKMKQDRFDSWLYLIQNPPVIEQPTLQEQIAAIDSQVTELLNQKGTLDGKAYQVSEKTAVGGIIQYGK